MKKTSTLNILVIGLLLCISISMGCLDTSTDMAIAEKNARVAEIFEEAMRLNGLCNTELQISKDLKESIWGTNNKVTDKALIMSMVTQYKRYDSMANIQLVYLNNNLEVLNSGNPKNWGTDSINAINGNIASHEEWYVEISETLGYSVVPQHTNVVKINYVSAPTQSAPTSYSYVPIGQSELRKEYEIKAERMAYLLKEMSNQLTIASNSMSCTAGFQTSIVDCRNYAIYFRGWEYQNSEELSRAGVPSGTDMFENVLYTCDQMDMVCVQLQNIPKY